MHTSNDALVYYVVRNGKVRESREALSTALYLDGVKVEFDADYSPIFSLKKGQFTDRVDLKSLHYRRLMHAMYWEAWHWMSGNFGTIQYHRQQPQVMTATQMVESVRDSYANRNGNLFFLTVFLNGLLKTDFVEKATVMPEYRYQSGL
jgi:hypothetical protein